MAGAVHRLFVAVYPPRDWCAEALKSVERLGPLAAHRVTPVDQVHMTLQFVGDTDERDVEDVVESVRRSVAGVRGFMLNPTRLVTMPRRGDPRLVALETDAPGSLLEMQQRLVKRLARRVKGESRFVPHITLLRFAGEARAGVIDERVKLAAFEVREVVLVKSILRPGGAEHAVIEEVALEQG